jgi:hypothetical protein
VRKTSAAASDLLTNCPEITFNLFSMNLFPCRAELLNDALANGLAQRQRGERRSRCPLEPVLGGQLSFGELSLDRSFKTMI